MHSSISLKVILTLALITFFISPLYSQVKEGKKLQWNGYIDFQYQKYDNKFSAPWDSSRFFIPNVALFLYAPALIDGSVYADIGLIYKYDKKWFDLDKAEINANLYETVWATIGAFPVPFGIEFERRNSPDNRLISRSVVMEKGIIPGTWTDVGLMLTDSTSGYNISTFVISGNPYTGSNVLNDNSLLDAKSIGTRIKLIYVPGLDVGASYIRGEWGTTSIYGTNRYSTYRYGFHFDADLNKLQPQAPIFLTFEYIRGEDEGVLNINYTPKTKRLGYYVEMGLQLIKFDTIVRYDFYKPDRSTDILTKRYISYGLRFNLIDKLKLKFEYQTYRNLNKKWIGDTLLGQVVMSW